jgi:hypothetical protein
VSRRGPRARAALLAILTLATLTAVACGGDDDGSGGGGGGISEADVQDAGLSYARCMRERGIDMPDPQPGVAGLRGLAVDEDRRNEPGFREAESECRKHLEDLVSEVDEDQRREFEQARLELARCMRDKGFDVPDPRQGGDLRAGRQFGDLDLDDPRVLEAIDACRAGLRSLGGGR